MARNPKPLPPKAPPRRVQAAVPRQVHVSEATPGEVGLQFDMTTFGHSRILMQMPGPILQGVIATLARLSQHPGDTVSLDFAIAGKGMLSIVITYQDPEYGVVVGRS